MVEKKSSSSTADNLKVSFLGALKVNRGVFIAFLVIFAISAFVSSKFLTFRNMMTIVRTIAPTALSAFGMTFVILTGGIDLSVGSYMSLSGCLTAILVSWYGIPTFAAVLISIAVGIFFGTANGLLITKMHMPPFIATMATMNVMRGISYTITGGRPVSVTADWLFEHIGAGFVGKVPIAAIYVVIGFIFLWFILNRTRFGRHLYAVGGNLQAAVFSGINTDRCILLTYIISGIFCSFCGIILVSRLNSGQPTIGEGSELDAIASCIIGGASLTGGAGTLTGTLVGALLIGVISNILNLIGVNSFVQLIVKGLLIVFTVYLNTMRKARRRKIKEAV